jgi:hypothetical protein
MKKFKKYLLDIDIFTLKDQNQMMMEINTLDGVKDMTVGSHQVILEFKDITVFIHNI